MHVRAPIQQGFGFRRASICRFRGLLKASRCILLLPITFCFLAQPVCCFDLPSGCRSIPSRAVRFLTQQRPESRCLYGYNNLIQRVWSCSSAVFGDYRNIGRGNTYREARRSTGPSLPLLGRQSSTILPAGDRGEVDTHVAVAGLTCYEHGSCSGKCAVLADALGEALSYRRLLVQCRTKIAVVWRTPLSRNFLPVC